ncbi:hypothetical protein GZ78_08450 [Endozoicomonas numazuensis]|uniref:Uncharacterized protein n=1 Tax=Endozoicomonas numazuensis TaxID=1137799 RepID=A0A081NGY8_9GAMM|nr:hypothetical protein GZ78_08450 [Endozoicomonas numazuensis]
MISHHPAASRCCCYPTYISLNNLASINLLRMRFMDLKPQAGNSCSMHAPTGNISQLIASEKLT